MEIKRTTEISVEKSRQFIIRHTKHDTPVFCPECGEPMITAEQTAQIFDISQRRIFQLIEACAAHFVETETGAVMVCLASLRECLETGERFLCADEEASGE